MWRTGDGVLFTDIENRRILQVKTQQDTVKLFEGGRVPTQEGLRHVKGGKTTFFCEELKKCLR